jgi:hypothetical protein
MSITFQDFMRLQVMGIELYAQRNKKPASAVAGEWIQKYAVSFRNLFKS